MVKIDGPPPEENTTRKSKRSHSQVGRLKSRTSSPDNATGRGSKVNRRQSAARRSKTSLIQNGQTFHHKVLIAVHPRIRYTLLINRIRVFDSDMDAKRRRAQATDQNEEGFLVHTNTPTHVSPFKDREDARRKRLDEPGPVWTSSSLKNGDDIFCWFACSGDGSNAGSYKTCAEYFMSPFLC